MDLGAAGDRTDGTAILLNPRRGAMRALARLLAALMLLVILFVGCELQLADSQQPGSPAPDPAAAPVDPSKVPPIHIASFNIQVFGTSKLRKRPVMNILAEVARRFDVMAIQEVRAKDDHVVPTFVELINSTGRKYDFVIGPRLGRTSSKEQYAFIFDTARIEVDRSSMYTVADPQDRFQREPTVVRFRVRGPADGQAFTFTLADIHTEPDEARKEMDALADVFVGIQNNGSGEDDVILLGDLNSDEYHLGRMGQLPGIQHVVTGVTTNTRRTHMYDNIMFDRRPTVEYTGRWGVLDLRNEYLLPLDQALEVSDHFPVWAEFSAYEGGAALAGRPAVAR
jgi:endonuclease/exonuclease/phosphatase family metal-dependent hydrolase